MINKYVLNGPLGVRADIQAKQVGYKVNNMDEYADIWDIIVCVQNLPEGCAAIVRGWDDSTNLFTSLTDSLDLTYSSDLLLGQLSFTADECRVGQICMGKEIAYKNKNLNPLFSFQVNTPNRTSTQIVRYFYFDLEVNEPSELGLDPAGPKVVSDYKTFTVNPLSQSGNPSGGVGGL